MRITKALAFSAVLVFALSTSANGQSKLQVEEIDSAQSYFGQLSLSPTFGSAYTIIPGLGAESGADGSDQGFFFSIAPDPDTGVVNDAIMDDQFDVVGADLADVFGAAAANPVEAYECLTSFGLDNATGRFRLELVVGVRTTGTELEYDTPDTDLQDPLDIGFDADGDGTITLAEGAGDGITGKGPDGVYGTADDIAAPDGFLDTGDGVNDAPFPLDPVGLVFLLDLDGDGDPMNDPPSPAVSQGLFIGANAGGTNIPFDAAGGEVTVETASWELLTEIDGAPADIDGDGVGDGPFDVTAFAVFSPPLGGGWMGDFGVGFVEDENPCSTMETVFGQVGANQLRVTYLSDVENEFCFTMDPVFVCGDVNMDGVLDLLDVAPFVNLIVNDIFQVEGDINEDGVVDILDVAPFVDKLVNG